MVSLAAFPLSCAQPTIMFYIYSENSKTTTSATMHLGPYFDEYYDTQRLFRAVLLPTARVSESSEDRIPKAFEYTDQQRDRWAGDG
jgi:hypothetical protein